MCIKTFGFIFCLFVVLLYNQNTQAQTIGVFDGQTDIGTIKHAGKATYDAKLQQYHVEGSGTNIWATHDDFHFVWKRMKGDFILRTNAAFIGKGVELHRKMGLMIRSTLDSNSKHVNAVVHGDGLTSLQYRKTISGITEEKKASITAADVIQLERKGTTFTMSVARKGELFVMEQVTGLDLGDDVYAGIFVCSHNADVSEQAVFNNTRIVVPAPASLVLYKQYLGSSIELLDLQTQNSTVVY